MAKYSEEMTNRICSFIEKDSYTIAEICKIVGINECTYYDWCNSKSEFSNAVKKARDKFDETMAVEAVRSLRKLVQGYEAEEVRTTYYVNKENEEVVRDRVVTRKHYQPSVPAVIFSLTNRDSENWKNRQNTEITGKDGKDLLPYQDMSRDEIMQEIEKIRAKMDGKG